MSGSNSCFLTCIQVSQDILYLILNPNPYNTDGPFSAHRQVIVGTYVAHVCVQEELNYLEFGSRQTQSCEYHKIKQVI